MTLRDKVQIMFTLVFSILQIIYSNSIIMQNAEAIVPISVFMVFYIGSSIIWCLVSAFIDEDIHEKSKNGYAVMSLMSLLTAIIMYDISMMFFCLDVISTLLYLMCYIIVKEKRNDEIL